MTAAPEGPKLRVRVRTASSGHVTKVSGEVRTARNGSGLNPIGVPMSLDLDPTAPEEASVGNYFVANYPPFSFWTPESIPAVSARLSRPPEPVELGLYVHIPFCRRRCDFCYFRVYTGREAKAVDRYVDAVVRELELYAPRPALAGRSPTFVYFGGGTPSFLDRDQLERLFRGLSRVVPFDRAEEITFECEPGTLDADKLRSLRDLGVTRLSLGVESFDADILELNNRAHRAREIHQAYAEARRVGFPQINIDLIAGLVGESEEQWRSGIRETLALAPDSVTIYQLEIPYNTTIYQRMKDGSERVAPVPDWETKRRWVDGAFSALEQAGYHLGSAYTAVRDARVRFRYRDGLWHGADLLGLGVASFSQVGGVHFQNSHHLDPYVEAVEAGQLPLHRAYVPTQEERFRREFLLQLKLGAVSAGYFLEKFGIDPRQRFAMELNARPEFHIDGDRIALSRPGLLRVDRLLEAFFLPAHRRARYS